MLSLTNLVVAVTMTHSMKNNLKLLLAAICAISFITTIVVPQQTAGQALSTLMSDGYPEPAFDQNGATISDTYPRTCRAHPLVDPNHPRIKSISCQMAVHARANWAYYFSTTGGCLISTPKPGTFATRPYTSGLYKCYEQSDRYSTPQITNPNMFVHPDGTLRVGDDVGVTTNRRFARLCQVSDSSNGGDQGTNIMFGMSECTVASYKTAYCDPWNDASCTSANSLSFSETDGSSTADEEWFLDLTTGISDPYAGVTYPAFRIRSAYNQQCLTYTDPSPSTFQAKRNVGLEACYDDSLTSNARAKANSYYLNLRENKKCYVECRAPFAINTTLVNSDGSTKNNAGAYVQCSNPLSDANYTLVVDPCTACLPGFKYEWDTQQCIDGATEQPTIISPVASTTIPKVNVTYVLPEPAAASSIKVTFFKNILQSYTVTVVGANFLTAGVHTVIIDPKSPNSGDTSGSSTQWTGTGNVIFEYADANGNEPVSVTINSITLDTVAVPITIESATASDGRFDVSFRIPEAPISGTVKMTLHPTIGSGGDTVLTLGSSIGTTSTAIAFFLNAAAVSTESYALGDAGEICSNVCVQSVSGPTKLTQDVYQVSMTYQDAAGNQASDSTFANDVLYLTPDATSTLNCGSSLISVSGGNRACAITSKRTSSNLATYAEFFSAAIQSFSGPNAPTAGTVAEQSSANAFPLPASSAFTFTLGVPGTTSTGPFTLSVGSVSSDYTLYDEPDEAVITCGDSIIDVGASTTCSFNPQKSSVQIYALASAFSLQASVDGIVSFGPLSPLTVANQFSFTVTGSASGQVTITNGVASVPVPLTVVDVADATSTLACNTTIVDVSSTMKCVFNAQKAGVSIIARRSVVNMRLTNTNTGNQLSTSTLAVARQFAVDFSSSSQLGETGKYTITTAAGVSLTIYVVAAPDGTSTLTCAQQTLTTTNVMNCTLVPKSSNTVIWARASAFSPQVTGSGQKGTVDPIVPFVGNAMALPYIAPAATASNEQVKTISAGLGNTVDVVILANPATQTVSSSIQCVGSPATIEVRKSLSCTLSPSIDGVSGAYTTQTTFVPSAARGSVTSYTQSNGFVKNGVASKYDIVYVSASDVSNTGADAIAPTPGTNYQITVYAQPNTATFTCAADNVAVDGVVSCTIVPRNGSIQIFALASAFQVQVDVGSVGSISPSVGNSLSFDFTAPSASQVATTEVRVASAVLQQQITATDTPDATSLLSCKLREIALNAATECTITPRKSSVVVYAVKSHFADTAIVQTGDSAGNSVDISSFPDFSNSYSFTVTATSTASQTGPFTLESLSKSLSLDMFSYASPDGANVACSVTHVQVSTTTTCTVTPTVSSAPVYARNTSGIDLVPNAGDAALSSSGKVQKTFSYTFTAPPSSQVVSLSNSLGGSGSITIYDTPNNAQVTCDREVSRLGASSMTCNVAPLKDQASIYALASAIAVTPSVSLSPTFSNNFTITVPLPQSSQKVTVSATPGSSSWEVIVFTTPNGGTFSCAAEAIDIYGSTVCTYVPSLNAQAPIFVYGPEVQPSATPSRDGIVVSTLPAVYNSSFFFTFSADTAPVNTRSYTISESNVIQDTSVFVIDTPTNATLTCPETATVGQVVSCSLVPLNASTVIFADARAFSIAPTPANLETPSRYADSFNFDLTMPSTTQVIQVTDGISSSASQITVLDTPDDSVISCISDVAEVSGVIHCVIIPKKAGETIITSSSSFTVNVDGASPSLSPQYGSSFSFSATVPAVSKKFNITDGVNKNGGYEVVVYDTADSTSDLQCSSGDAVLASSSVTCQVTPRKAGQIIYALRSTMEPGVSPTPQFSSATLSNDLSGFIARNSFVFTFNAPSNIGDTGVYTLSVGPSAASHTVTVFSDSIDSVTLACSSYVLPVGTQVTGCTATPFKDMAQVYVRRSDVGITAPAGTVQITSSDAFLNQIVFSYTAPAASRQVTVSSSPGSETVVFTATTTPSKAVITCAQSEALANASVSCTINVQDSNSDAVYSSLAQLGSVTADILGSVSALSPDVAQQFAFSVSTPLLPAATGTMTISALSGAATTTINVYQIPQNAELSCADEIVDVGSSTSCTVRPVANGSRIFARGVDIQSLLSVNAVASRSTVTGFSNEFSTTVTVVNPGVVTLSLNASQASFFGTQVTPSASSTVRCDKNISAVGETVTCTVIAKDGNGNVAMSAAADFGPSFTPSSCVSVSAVTPAASTSFTFTYSGTGSCQFTVHAGPATAVALSTTTDTPDSTSSISSQESELTVTSPNTRTDDVTSLLTLIPRKNSVDIYVLPGVYTLGDGKDGSFTSLGDSAVPAKLFESTYTSATTAGQVSISDNVSGSPALITIKDINGCANPDSPCFAGVSCTDDSDPGPGFTCGACPTGYQGNGITCTDIDSCAPNPCFNNSKCTDLAAPLIGFTCLACPPGYEDRDSQAVAGTDCIDIDSCKNNPCAAGQNCTDIPAPATGFTCGNCPPGETLNEAGNACIDQDGCADTPCFEGVQCTDIPAPGFGFTCAACPAGYEGNGITCTDIDGCANSPCFAGVQCTDVGAPGTGFICGQCPAGFEGNGTHCTDIDGCAVSPCFAGVQCDDVAAPNTGRVCGDCPAGYEGDGATCTDVNGCDPNQCFQTETCQDVAAPGTGFTCAPCPTGYVGNGVFCVGYPDRTSEITCSSNTVSVGGTLQCQITARNQSVAINALPDKFQLASAGGQISTLNSQLEFTFTASSTSAQTTITSSNIELSITVYVVDVPDSTSTMQCSTQSGLVNAGASETCTFTPKKAGQVVFMLTNGVTGISALLTPAASDSSSALSVSPVSTPIPIAVNSLAVTATTQTSGDVVLSNSYASASFRVVGTPDSTSTCICPSPVMLINTAITCTVTPRADGVRIYAGFDTLSTPSDSLGTFGAFSPSSGVAATFTIAFTAGGSIGTVAIDAGLASTTVQIVSNDVAPFTPNPPMIKFTGSRDLLVNWTLSTTTPFQANSPIESHTLQRATRAAGSADALVFSTVYTGALTTFAETSLSKATEYHYRVAGTNRIGTSEFSAPASKTSPDVPNAPTLRPIIESFINQAHTIALNWTAAASSSQAPVTSYRVEARLSSGSDDDYTVRTTTRGALIASLTVDGTNLVRGSAYLFRIVAVNAYGASASSATQSLAVSNSPSVPSIASTVSISVSEIRVSWTVPSTNGQPITSYTLEAKLASADDSSFAPVYTGSNLVFVHTGLSASSSYSYRLSATNIVGTSDFSAVQTGLTLGATPSEPRNVVAASATTSSVTLTWDVPALADPSVAQYRIEMAKISTPAETFPNPTYSPVGVVAGDVLTFTATDLTSSVTYGFRVSAKTAASAYGPVSAVVNKATEGAVPSPPYALVVDAAVATTSTSFQVKWSAPLFDGNPLSITKYRVYYAAGQTEQSADTADSVTLTKLIESLSPFTTYSVSVTAFNGIGESARSGAISVTTLATAPSQPQSLQVASISITDTSATVSWNAPASNGGRNVLDYVVEYGQAQQTRTLVFSLGTTLQLTGLSASTTYVVRVAARNAFGQGAFTVDAAFGTLPSGPVITSFVASDPDNLDSIYSDNDVLTVTFDVATNEPAAASKSDIDALFTFNPADIGTAYTGSWTSPTTLVITVTDVGILGQMYIGSSTIRANGGTAGVRNAAATSAGSTSQATLSGNFGTPSANDFSNALTIPGGITTLEDTDSAPFVVSVDPSIDDNVDLELTVSINDRGADGYLARASSPSTSLSITVTGTASAINAALAADGIVYSAVTDFNGAATLEVALKRNSVLVAIEYLIVTVTPVVDAPRIFGQGSNIASLTVGSSAQFGNLFRMSSVEPGEYEVWLISDSSTGQITISDSASSSGITTPVPLNVPQNAAVMQGSIADLNTALSSATYSNPSASSGVRDTVQIVISNLAAPSSRLYAFAYMYFDVVCSSDTAAPTLTSASFSSAGGHIDVVFSDVVYFSSAYVSCDTTFASSTTDKFGTAYSCTWVSSKTLQVLLGIGASIVPGDSITLGAASGVVRCDGSNQAASGSVSVASPENPVRPSVQVVTTSSIGSCDNLAVSAVASGLGSRDGSFIWSFSPSIELPSSVTASTSSFTVESFRFAADTTYTVSVTVTNFFGAQSETATASVYKSAADVPTLKPFSPLSLSVSKSAPVTLSARASTSPCSSSSGTLTFVWSLESSTDSNIQSMTSLIATGKTAGSSSPSLRILGGVLAAGKTYVLKLTTTTANSLSSSLTFTVDVQTQDLQVSIAGGSARSVPVSADIALECAVKDPDSTADSLSIAWTCQTADARPCVDLTSDNGDNVALASQSKVTVAAGKLAPAGVYQFTCTASKGNRQSSAAQEISLIDTASPEVVITRLSPAVMRDTGALILSGSIANSVQGTPTYSWSVTRGAINSQYSTSGATLLINTAGAAGVFTAGSTVVLTLTATVNGKSGSASISTQINSNPGGGKLTVEPSSGIELSTEFTLSADGFSDTETASSNLRYRYFFYDAAQPSPDVWLSSIVRSRSITVSSLPAGNPLIVGCYVIDELGASIRATATATVTSAALSSSDISSRVDAAITKYDQASDVTDLLQELIGIVQNVQKASFSASEIGAISSKVVSAVVKMQQSGQDNDVILEALEQESNLQGSNSGDDVELSLGVIQKIQNDRPTDDTLTIGDASTVLRVLASLLQRATSLQSSFEDSTSSSSLQQLQFLRAGLVGASSPQLSSFVNQAQTTRDIYDAIWTELNDLTNDTLVADGEDYSFDASTWSRIRRVQTSSVNPAEIFSLGTSSGSQPTMQLSTALFNGLSASATTDLYFVLSNSNPFSFGTGVSTPILSPTVSFRTVDATTALTRTLDTSSNKVQVAMPCDLNQCSPGADQTCHCECFLFSFSNNMWSNSSVTSKDATQTSVICETASSDFHVAVFARLENNASPPPLPPASSSSDGFPVYAIAIIAVVGVVGIGLLLYFFVFKKRADKAPRRRAGTSLPHSSSVEPDSVELDPVRMSMSVASMHGAGGTGDAEPSTSATGPDRRQSAKDSYLATAPSQRRLKGNNADLPTSASATGLDQGEL
jgi:REJ domain/Fibronectin type III domain